MVAAVQTTDYLQAIREQVCSRCIERPPGGPPCLPRGKFCGVELHLPELIDSVRGIKSTTIAPYLEHNRNDICAHCTFLHSSICPCPMDYLAVLLVEAVEGVDRQKQQAGGSLTPTPERVHDMDAIHRAYERGTGNWTGCDWPTQFGTAGLNLQGVDSRSLAASLEGAQPGEDWRNAVKWLSEVERRAKQAEREAAAAVKAVADDRWEDALHHVLSAWALEFSTGRPLHGKFRFAWQTLREEIETQYLARNQTEKQGSPT